MGHERDFSVIRRIAVGGTAEIVLARRANGEPVVIKRLLDDADESMVGRMRREAEILTKIRSPYVVQLVAHEPRSLVLEYVDGIDVNVLLQRLVKRGEALSIGAVIAVGSGLCGALRALHAIGFVHADVSPANVLLGRDGAVKLTDFGVARRIDGPPPSSQEGTLGYQPPEQLGLEPIDGRADVYSAALILYELVTGTSARPAGQLGVAELRTARTKLPAPPSAVRPGLPKEIDDVLLCALDPNAAGRPSPVEWLEALASLPAPSDPSALRNVVLGAIGAPIASAHTAASAPLKRTAILDTRPLADTMPVQAQSMAKTQIATPRTKLQDPTEPTAMPVDEPALEPTAPGGRTWSEAAGALVPQERHAEDEDETNLITAARLEEKTAPSLRLLPLPSLQNLAQGDAVTAPGSLAEGATAPSQVKGSSKRVVGWSLVSAVCAVVVALFAYIQTNKPAVEAPPKEVPELPAPPPDAPIVVARPTEPLESPPPEEPMTPTTPKKIRTKIPKRPAQPSRIVVSSSSPLRVVGPGMNGAAPQTSAPLDGQATLIDLNGRDMAIKLRTVRKAEGFEVTVGAPPGTYYQAKCTGRPERATPVIGLPLRGRLACKVTNANGAAVEFELRLL